MYTRKHILNRLQSCLKPLFNNCMFLTIAVLFLSAFLSTVSAQDSRPEPFPRRTYLELGTGVNLLSYRDFATSPLFYDGPVLAFSVSHLQNSLEEDDTFTFSGSYGETTAEVNDFLVGISTAFTYRLIYTRLFRLDRFSTDRWNFKAGGTLSSIAAIRQNPSLRNNQTGFEIFGTLSGSGSVSRDVSRERRKNVRFLFLDIPLPPRARTLTFQFHVPVMNSAFRNNYIYTSQADVVNSDEALDDYEFRLFSGYRVFSSLQYRLYLKNSNAIQFSYDWDALRSPGDAGTFELAHHTFTFSLLYNLN